jgi:class 3 adenylate cyclase
VAAAANPAIAVAVVDRSGRSLAIFRGTQAADAIVETALSLARAGAFFRWALKYIGDAVMAVWLHDRPADKQRQIVRILRASCEFARTTAALRQQFDLPHPFLLYPTGIRRNTI